MICATGYAQTWEKVPKRTQAQATAGLSGGEGWQMIFSIQYAPTNANTVYFVTDTNQVWKTTNANGTETTWTRKANGFLCNGGLSLAIDPTDENIVYVAGSGHNNAGNESVSKDVEGIMRTTDGGDNWTLVTTQSYATHAPQAHFHRDARGGNHIAFAGTDIYAAPSGGGLLRSADGITWALVPKNGGGYVLDTVDCRNISIHPSSIAGSATCFVSATNGLWRIRYNNGSATVTAIGSGLPSYPYQIAFGTSTPNTIYAADATSGVYRSTDGGVTFSARNNGLSSPISSGGSAKFIAMSPANANRLFVTFQGLSGRQLYYTNDGGANWTQTSNMDEQNADGWVCGSTFGYTSNISGINGSTAPLACHPTDGNVALVNGWGSQVKKTTDGGVTWKYSNTGYTGATLSQYGSIPIGWDSTNANRATFFHSDFGALITTNGEDIFSNIKTTYNGRVDSKCGAMRGDIVVAAIGPTGAQRLHVSRDSGASWTGLPGTELDYYFIAFHPQDSDVVYADKYRFSNIQSNNTYGTLSTSVRGIYSGDGDIVYSYSGNTISKSVNNGTTWTTPYPSLGIPAGFSVSQITVDPGNENRIYAAVRGKGIYIVNGSDTVQLKDDSDGLELSQFGSVDTYTVVTDPDTNIDGTTTVYAGTLRHNRGMTPGVYRSIDAGVTWTNITGNLDNINVVNLSVNPNNNYVYLDSYSGAWKLPPPGTSGTGTPGAAPTVTTGTATAVTTTTATLHAEVNPNGSSTTCRWQYNTASQSWGTATVTGSQTVGAGTSSVGMTQSITDLAGSTTYYVRTQANSANGSTNGDETSFTTSQKLSLNISMGTPTVNGNLSDWSAITNPIAVVISGSATAANGSWAAKWNNTGLYLAFVGSDTTSYTDSGNNTYLDDSFELYIDRDGNGGTSYDSYDFHLGWNYHGTFTKAYNGTTTGIAIGTSSASGGYIIEVAIPWAAFPGGDIPGSGTVIGVDVQFNDDTNGGNTREMAKNWNAETGQDTDYFNPSTFGEFVLLGEGDGEGGGGAAGTSTVQITKDAYANSNATTTNYGTQTTIDVRYGSPSFRRQAYLEADIGNPGSVTAVKLKVYGTSTSNPTRTIYVYGINSGSWTESGLTWDNKPTTQTASLATFATLAAGTISAWYDVDITNYAQTVGTTTLSLCLSSNAPPDGVILYLDSSESGGTTTPYFEVSYDGTGTDTANPTGTITINSGNTYATSTAVTLILTATDDVGVTGYYLSGSTTTPTAGQAGWVTVGTDSAYSANIPYTLSSGDGTKTVYVWYKDGVNNISSMSQDAIVLDETFPTIVVVSPSSIYTDDLGRKAFGTTGTTITLTGSSADTNGIGTVTISNSATTTTYTATGTDAWSKSLVSIISGTANVFSVTAQDIPGNQDTDTVAVGAIPAVTTDYALSVALHSATLVGSCTANNNTTTVWFDYGTIEGYYTGSSSTVTVTGSADTAVNISLGNLSRSTTIYYRISGSNTVGVTHGEEFDFTTSPGIATNSQFNSMDMHFPGSTRFNAFLKANGIYPGLFWARNAGTKDGIDLRNDPDTVLTNFRGN